MKVHTAFSNAKSAYSVRSPPAPQGHSACFLMPPCCIIAADLHLTDDADPQLHLLHLPLNLSYSRSLRLIEPPNQQELDVLLNDTRVLLQDSLGSN